jgi:hypothetical protein
MEGQSGKGQTGQALGGLIGNLRGKSSRTRPDNTGSYS